MVTFKVSLKNTDLVPLYAFVDDPIGKCELYLREAGMQTGLRFMFQCWDPSGTTDFGGEISQRCLYIICEF